MKHLGLSSSAPFDNAILRHVIFTKAGKTDRPSEIGPLQNRRSRKASAPCTSDTDDLCLFPAPFCHFSPLSASTVIVLQLVTEAADYASGTWEQHCTNPTHPKGSSDPGSCHKASPASHTRGPEWFISFRQSPNPDALSRGVTSEAEIAGKLICALNAQTPPC